tara:strand:+ start:254 stop:565 length:312 start_codon:yes stop_codon:yes gene_type:complete
MKLTRTYLKQLIKEEMGHVQIENTETADLDNAGEMLADAIAKNSLISKKLELLNKKPQIQKDKFVAYFANLLGVDLTGGASANRVRSAQKKAAADSPEVDEQI